VVSSLEDLTSLLCNQPNAGSELKDPVCDNVFGQGYRTPLGAVMDENRTMVERPLAGEMMDTLLIRLMTVYGDVSGRHTTLWYRGVLLV
jgi:hypothetical protein